jgi:hypothetical protein
MPAIGDESEVKDIPVGKGGEEKVATSQISKMSRRESEEEPIERDD